jgi:hypothetical protein
MNIEIVNPLKSEIENLSRSRGISVESLLTRLFRVGLTIQKNIDSDSQVFILNPASNHKVILIPISK